MAQHNKVFRILNLAFLLLALTSGCVTRHSTQALREQINAEQLEFGIYEVTNAPNQTDYHAGTGNYKFHRTGGNWRFSNSTNIIPAALNTHFGLRYRISGIPPGKKVQITQVTRHPPIRRPDGTVTDGFITHFSAMGKDYPLTNANGYVFEEPYELVMGEWSMELWFYDKMLLKQTFIVTDPNK